MFAMYDTLLERSLQLLQDLLQNLSYSYGFAGNLKKCCLGGKNNYKSSESEKMLKIVNADKIKDIDETD